MKHSVAHETGAPCSTKSARELAWFCEQLCALSIDVRADGSCMGELRPNEVVMIGRSVQRSPDPAGIRGWMYRWLSTRRTASHLKRKHDDGCLALGVPHHTLRSLVAAWSKSDADTLVIEALDEAIQELQTTQRRGESWTRERAMEACRFAIRQRLTPTVPREMSKVSQR